MLVLFVDNFCKQYGPRLGPRKDGSGSGSKLFNNIMVFLIEVGFEGKIGGEQEGAKLPSRQPIFCHVLIIEFVFTL